MEGREAIGWRCLLVEIWRYLAHVYWWTSIHMDPPQPHLHGGAASWLNRFGLKFRLVLIE